jgi:VanZ family protein
VLPLKYPARWQFAGIAFLILALTAALLPEIPFWPDDPAARFEFSDKVLHMITFAFLAAWFSGQYSRASYWRIAVGLLAFGALIELIQGTVTYRSSEWLDLYADGIGIVSGLIISLLGLGGWSARLERRME